MRVIRLFPGAILVLWAGCATLKKAPPEPPGQLVPEAPPVCAAAVTIPERTNARMSLSVENKSESRAGAIKQVRLLFTTARCPLSVQSPEGWAGSINTRKGERACEVAWISNETSGVAAGSRKEGFVAVFRPGKTETPSWAVFLDQCAVSGTERAKAR